MFTDGYSLPKMIKMCSTATITLEALYNQLANKKILPME